MLTEAVRASLATTGIAHLSGVVDRAGAEGMADRVWEAFSQRGIDRLDRSTWPVGLLMKNQALRRGDVFEAFRTDTLATAYDEVFGPGEWHDPEPWGPALVTFPEPGPWTLPHRMWHLDLAGRGDPDRTAMLRMFGFVSDVEPQGGGTLVVEGSHELVRRMVAAAPGNDAGRSSELRAALAARHPWFRALGREGGDHRVARFMTDGDEIDGVRVRVAELTGRAGDVALMLPWTMHNLAPNTNEQPRLMVSHTAYRAAPRRTTQDKF